MCGKSNKKVSYEFKTMSAYTVKSQRGETNVRDA